MKSANVAACSAALSFALLALSAQYAAAQQPADSGPPPDATAPANAPPPANPGPPGGGPPAAAGPPAVTNTTVNLRQGPGTTYTIVTKIPAGAPLDVAGCSGQWCQVTYQGQNGYVIATSLGGGGPGGPPPPPGAAVAAYPPGYVPPPVYVVPPPYYGPYYGYGPYYRGYYGGWRGPYRRW
jgi:Bacterial SH3 domain